jgi:hypothetical protein
VETSERTDGNSTNFCEGFNADSVSLILGKNLVLTSCNLKNLVVTSRTSL